MRIFKLTLAYDGTAYAGWQSQPNQRTLQDTLEAALAHVTGEAIRVVASGRTDAGVHALGQVVSFPTVAELAPEEMQKALNAVLPDDMAVLAAAEAPLGFHAIHDAASKRYRYVIHDGPVRDVFRRRHAWHYRRRLDAEAMHSAAQALAGTHDFRSFESAWPQRTSSVRTIFEIGVARASGATPPIVSERSVGDANATSFMGRTHATSSVVALVGGAHPTGEDDLVILEVEADGFLYNMVRAIVGTLVEVGRGVRGETWPGEVLAALDRRAAGMTAPPQGLCLVRVDYGDERRGSLVQD